MSNLDGEQQAVRALRIVLKDLDDARAEVERLRATDKEAKSAFAPWVQGPGIVGGILHLQEEVERLRADANARAVEELRKLEVEIRRDKCVTDGDGSPEWPHVKNAYNSACDNHADMVCGRIAELSKPAAKGSEPVKNERCGDWPLRDYVAGYNPLTASPLETAVYHLCKTAMPARLWDDGEVRRGGKS